MSNRIRADRLLLERGLFESRAKAQAAIADGKVTANGTPVRQPSDPLDADAIIQAEPAHPYVSRGGVKLAAALDHFGFDPKGCTCLDVGASTGGFTDVLVRRGAARVYAVDVGRDQLDPRIKLIEAVVSLEESDIRQINPSVFTESPSFLVIDVSFISLRLVLPAVIALAAPSARLIALIKPQFEAGRAELKKGIVRNSAVHTRVCEELSAFVSNHGWTIAGIIPSPIKGGDGNREFLIGAQYG